MSKNGYSTGLWAESFAKHYLEHQGLQWLQSRYRSPVGEIDLIMQENYPDETLAMIIFVEVRYRQRSHSLYGTALESIDQRKQKRLYQTAQYYLQTRPNSHQIARIGVVALTGPMQKPRIEWIKNAFSMHIIEDS